MSRRRCSRWTSPRAAWTARPRPSWREELRRRARRGPGGDRRHPRPRVRRRLRRARGAARRRARDRRRARRELLAGGWYFATETARILGGAGGALLPEQGAELLRARASRATARLAGVSWPLASFLLVGAGAGARLARLRAQAPVGADGRGGGARSRRSPRSAATRSWRCPTSSRSPRSRSSSATRSARCPASPSARSGCSPRTSCSARAPTRPGRWRPGAGRPGRRRCSARLSGRRLGRVPLALCCALAALAAKEIMNVYTWTLGASHTPAAFLVVAGAALPFDLTDTVASFLFGLAFGPELARLLARMRARMDVRWEPAASPGSRAHCSEGLERQPVRVAMLAVLAARHNVRRRRHVRARVRRIRRQQGARRVAVPRALLPDLRPERRRRLRRPRAGRAAASCTRPGRRSASPPPGATRRACAATGTRCSTRCAAKPRR